MACGAIEKDFNFWMPIDIVKAKKDEMRIGGIATDEEGEDLQGEKVFIDGLDISYLLQRGAFNWDHGKDPGDILGEIDSAQKQGKKLYVEGFLYPTVRKATEVYDLIRSLKESGSKRRLGLSIEGKVKERDNETGKSIKKAWVKNVAITYNPINQGAWIDFIKSLGKFAFEVCDNDCSKCTFCEVDKSVSSEGSKEQPGSQPAGLAAVVKSQEELKEGVKPETQKESPSADNRSKVLPSEDSNKALAAGHDIPATSGGASGSALREESLEKDKPKVTTYTKEHLALQKKKKRKGTFTKSELTEWLQEEMGYPTGMANLMSDLLFKAVQVAGYIRTRRGHLERVKPFTRELSHELHRISTMSDSALATRATKISHPDKMLHFYHAAKEAGKSDLAAIIKHEGIKRLGLKESDFISVRQTVASGLSEAEEKRSTAFGGLTSGGIPYSRKPVSFDEVRTEVHLRPNEQKLYKELPMAKVQRFPGVNPVEPKKVFGGSLYRMKFGDQEYLVDTQGYDYPRYVTKVASA